MESRRLVAGRVSVVDDSKREGGGPLDLVVAGHVHSLEVVESVCVGFGIEIVESMMSFDCKTANR